MTERDLFGRQPDDAELVDETGERQSGAPSSADSAARAEADGEGSPPWPTWPTTPDIDGSGAIDAGTSAAPAPGEDETPPPRPERHSRNPVDRLTRRLPRPLRITIDWLVTIAGAVAIVLLVKAYVVNPYRIPTSSMEPTLHCASPGTGCEARFSDRVLANRFIYHLRDPRRGEIIVFKTPPEAEPRCGAGGTFVKRIIGLPGDRIEERLIRGDGYVFINGRRLEESYVKTERRQVSQDFGPVTVPRGSYFMMGDNRESSCDSRAWGSVPRRDIIGKVFATYWPPNRLSLH